MSLSVKTIFCSSLGAAHTHIDADSVQLNGRQWHGVCVCVVGGRGADAVMCQRLRGIWLTSDVSYTASKHRRNNKPQTHEGTECDEYTAPASGAAAKSPGFHVLSSADCAVCCIRLDWNSESQNNAYPTVERHKIVISDVFSSIENPCQIVW